MSQQEIEQIELSIEEAKKIVKKGELAEKLAANPDFKKLILEDYFQNEAARLAHLLSDPNIGKDQKEQVMYAIHGVGMLKQWLQGVTQMGRYAQKSIEEHEEEHEHIRLEELEEGDTA